MHNKTLEPWDIMSKLLQNPFDILVTLEKILIWI